ncbi:arginase [Dyadobacter koreensis]|uniref:Arginase n=1 Tax=Dyadobacter koreensis TaxID=408657 RepID=A0A1H6Q5Q6_9BACT|nr:arginase family protein [Dyadobacter koreensis]SEI39113.1 arginase [Dyadobacter koreensis]
MTSNRPIQPPLLHFPQWQGSGLTNEVQIGVQTLRDYFHETTALSVQLSFGPLTRLHNIIAYQPLLTQLQNAKNLLEQNQPEKLVLIAGDCAAEVAPVDYLNKLYGEQLTIVWLDAHGDLNTPESSESGHFHGMPLRLLLDGEFGGTNMKVSSPIESSQVLLAGLRDLDTPENTFISENSIPVFTDIINWKQQLLDKLLERNTKYLYIHLDLDVLDPDIFPAVKCPSPNGFNPKTVAKFIQQAINDYDVIGLSLTETIAETQQQLEPIEDILGVYKNYLTS